MASANTTHRENKLLDTLATDVQDRIPPPSSGFRSTSDRSYEKRTTSHHIDQQFCRWLLPPLDRLPDNQVAMTRELIANMLGLRREGVTEAAGKLQDTGVIEYRRGRITVLGRPRLERLSCECYLVV